MTKPSKTSPANPLVDRSPIVLRFTKEADTPDCYSKLEAGDRVVVSITATVKDKMEREGKEFDGQSSYEARIELEDYKIEVEPAKKGAKSIKDAMDEIESKRKT